MQRFLCVTRPFGVAFAVFTFLNLALALENPQLAVTRIWLDLHLEPEQTFFGAFLGLALLVPHDWARAPGLRWILGGVFFGFWILVGAGVIRYYHELHQGRFATDLPVPFSLLVFTVLIGEFARISWWAPRSSRLPPPAWYFTRGTAVLGAFFLLILAHIVTFGRTDFRRPADAAVVLGAKVYDDSRPCAALEDRLRTAIELYEDGVVSYLIMSGGVGANGISEAEVMRDYAHRRGVPLTRIVLDPAGVRTVDSAIHCGRIARERGFRGLLVVTQYFHCARVKIVFKRLGTHCYTVPTCSSNWRGQREIHLSREDFFLFREAVAFPFYFVYYR